MSGLGAICCVGRFEAANRIGDLIFAAYCCHHLTTNLLAAGDPLDEVQGEAERGLAFAQKMRFGLGIDFSASAARARFGRSAARRRISVASTMSSLTSFESSAVFQKIGI